MKTSQNGINLIKKYEGFRAHAYKAVETESYFTIGYGHYGADVKEDDVMTEDMAEIILKKDVASAEKSVNALLKSYSLTQEMFDALVSFTYNCGVGNLVKLTAKNTRTIDEIGNSFKLYNKAGGKVLKGLSKRRAEEAELFFSGKAPEDDYYMKYSGASMKLDVVLQSVGVSSYYIGSVTRRRPIAEANHITGYSGSYVQNMRLIQLAKSGHLKKVKEG